MHARHAGSGDHTLSLLRARQTVELRNEVGDGSGLERYSQRALERVWRVQHFSWWMTSMLHRFADDDDFQLRLQLSQLRFTTSSAAQATALAENYVGMPFARR